MLGTNSDLRTAFKVFLITAVASGAVIVDASVAKTFVVDNVVPSVLSKVITLSGILKYAPCFEPINVLQLDCLTWMFKVPPEATLSKNTLFTFTVPSAAKLQTTFTTEG